jgi:hypothetical protein
MVRSPCSGRESRFPRPTGDELTVQGFTFDQPTNVYAITGGTGRWRNAGGQAVVHEISQTEARITLFISDLG